VLPEMNGKASNVVSKDQDKQPWKYRLPVAFHEDRFPYGNQLAHAMATVSVQPNGMVHQGNLSEYAQGKSG